MENCSSGKKPASQCQLPEFHLPIELRLQIWKCASNPQIIKLRANTDDEFYIEELIDFSVLSGDRCVILYVCHESRIVALQTHDVCLSIWNERGHWFQPLYDTIWLEEDGWNEMSKAFCNTKTGDIKTDNIKSLAISDDTFWSFGAKRLFGAEWRHFRVDELIILTENDDPDLVESIRVLKEQNPEFQHLVANIMTESMLTDKFS
jgi:2EXR family